MPLPASPDARLFYRCALQRLEESAYLLTGEYRTAAVYLAGYAVECILKALILSQASHADRKLALKSFKGAHAHDFGWLKGRYVRLGGSPFPTTAERHFIQVATWSTDLRYQAGTWRKRETEVFMKAAAANVDWADGRL